MIEARGAKRPYVSTLKATRVRGGRVLNSFTMIFDAADSEDEAFGRALRAAHLAFPYENGWGSHHAIVKDIGDVDWIGPHDFSKIEPIE